MRVIDWNKPIIGGDGKQRDWKEIEHFFLNLFEEKIKDNLKNLKCVLSSEASTPRVFIADLNLSIKWLRFILLASPRYLENLAEIVRYVKWGYVRNYGISSESIKDFSDKLLDAFNYSQFRDAKLNRLAVVVNVKTCLYCNQQYTIAIGKNPNKNGNISLVGSDAFLQFDHFFGKAEYPILSMSLYNLIPSCPLCNQKKSGNNLSLKLHPFLYDLSSLIRFRIKSQDALINPRMKNWDVLEVEIDTFGNKEIKDFVDNLDLERRYARHLDIAEELEVTFYMSSYYNGHFDDINSIFDKGNGYEPERLKSLHRHFKGFYDDPDDINKRPLTKFSQDIYTQLCSWYCLD